MKKDTLGLSLVVAGMLFVWAPPVPIDAQAQQKPTVSMPQPGVPQIMTMEGSFVRAAYNDEGYVIISYEPVQRSIGEQWVLLDIGVTVRDRVPDFKLTRDALSLETPDGKTIPLPSDSEHRAGNTSALRESGTSPARLDQLLSAERDPGVPHRLLRRSRFSRDGVGRGRAELRLAPASAGSFSTCLPASRTASIGST